jgi:hypothetical protein
MNFGLRFGFVMDIIIYDACDGYCDIYDACCDIYDARDGYCDIYVMYMFFWEFLDLKTEKNQKNWVNLLCAVRQAHSKFTQNACRNRKIDPKCLPQIDHSLLCASPPDARQ